MKLYVIDKIDGKKIYLNKVASTKGELSRILGSNRFKIDGQIYSISEVHAENKNQDLITGVASGFLAGVAFGVGAILAGAVIGGVLGLGSESIKSKNANNFNESIDVE